MHSVVSTSTCRETRSAMGPNFHLAVLVDLVSGIERVDEVRWDPYIPYRTWLEHESTWGLSEFLPDPENGEVQIVSCQVQAFQIKSFKVNQDVLGRVNSTLSNYFFNRWRQTAVDRLECWIISLVLVPLGDRRGVWILYRTLTFLSCSSSHFLVLLWFLLTPEHYQPQWKPPAFQFFFFPSRIDELTPELQSIFIRSCSSSYIIQSV